MSSTNVQLARQYLEALERGGAAEQLERFWDPEVVYREHPNRIAPQGATRDAGKLREARERGRHVVEDERYEVRDVIAMGDKVVLQVEWSGTLKVALGSLAAGDRMRASSAMFLRFRDGRIVAQENYDCFAPF